MKLQISLPWLGLCTLLFAALEGWLIITKQDLQWQWLAIYGYLMISLSPIATKPSSFFRGDLTSNDLSRDSFALLSASAFITWIFAKSIYNSAVLGARFGIVGGVAYAGWYTSFACVAFTVYQLRKQGYHCLSEAVNHRYGHAATVTFGLTILYRLYQEIWSNSIVVASFYGEFHSFNWWLAAILSTAIPLAYVGIGGMRSSLLSDFVQAGSAVAFMAVILSVIFIQTNDLDCSAIPANSSRCSLWTWNPVPGRERWSLEGGLDLLAVSLMQGCTSYGFMDPVLTDRAFLIEPKRMVKAFILGGSVAGAFILLFSLFGVYGNMLAAVEAGQEMFAPGVFMGVPADVAMTVSTAFFSVVNLVFITSSISTLDSTFCSVAKLAGPELMGFMTSGRPRALSVAQTKDIWTGRLMMVIIAVCGTLTLLTEQTALNATTVSGTVVLGLGPPILGLAFFGVKGYRPLCFHMPFWSAASIGVAYSIGSFYPEKVDLSLFSIGTGAYAKLLGWNVLGAVLAWGSFLLFFLENWHGEALPSDEDRRWHMDSIKGLGEDWDSSDEEGIDVEEKANYEDGDQELASASRGEIKSRLAPAV
ncbi:unnamed protein product [Chrysoparadoxa australica]